MYSAAWRDLTPDEARRDSTRSSPWNSVYLTVLFLGIHTALTASILPHGFAAFVGACGIAIVNSSRYSIEVLLWFVFTLIALVVVGLAASITGNEGAIDNTRAVLNFVYDIFIGFNVYIGITELGLKKVGSLAFRILLVLIVLSILEVLDITKSLSDWFRESTLASGLYIRNERDLLIYGIIRPKVFASEPAKLGETMSICFLIWLSSIRLPTSKQYIIAIFILLICLFFVRSPVIMFGLIAYLLVRCVTRDPHDRRGRLASIIVMQSYALLAILVPSVSLWLITNYDELPAYVLSGSFFARIIVPFYMAVHAFDAHPLFGIGLVAGDSLTVLAISAYSATGKLAEVPVDAWTTLGPMSCSAFWFCFITLGIVGAIVLYVSLMGLFRILAVPVPLWKVCIIVCFTFWLMFGRVNSPVAWVTFFLVVAICELRIREYIIPSLRRSSLPNASLSIDRARLTTH